MGSRPSVLKAKSLAGSASSPDMHAQQSYTSPARTMNTPLVTFHATTRRSFASTSTLTSDDHLSSSSPTLDFDSLQNLYPVGESSGWYVMVCTTLLAFRKEKMVGDLWAYLSTKFPDQEKQLVIARRLRETMLKASVLLGFPKGINGLAALQSSLTQNTPALLPILSQDTSIRSPLPASTKLCRGHDFFSKIYDKHTDTVLKNMGESSGGELSYYALMSVYGELMAEVSILNAKDTVLVEFVSCMAGGAGPQAKGHMFGSRNVGASGDEVRGSIAIVREMGARLGVEIYEAEMPFLEKTSSW